MRPPLALSLGLLFATSSASAQKQLHHWQQPADHHFGAAVHGVGDVNNDGYDDVAVTAPAYTFEETPFVDVYSGLDGTVLLKLNSQFGEGQNVEPLGDVNGDGHDDFMVGNAILADVVLYSGMDGTEIDTLDYTFGSFGSPSSGFASSIAAIGDLNGDAITDFAVGAIQPEGCHAASCPAGKGFVTAFSGADRSVLFVTFGQSNGDAYGWSVDAAGDVDNDGVPDIIVGTLPTFQTPYVQVLSGIDGSVIHHLDGTNTFGFSVAGIGDLDNDGHSEFLVGEPGFSNGTLRVGAVYVYNGFDASVLTTHVGTEKDEQLGTDVEGTGDFTADGTPDYLLDTGTFVRRRSNTTFNQRRTLMVSGKTGNVFATIHGNRPGDLYQEGVAPAGDVNGDGIEDIILGNSNGGQFAGTATVYSGSALFIHANTDNPYVGETLRLIVQEGQPFTACMLAVVEVNGIPTFSSKGITSLDGTGRRIDSLTVQPSFVGLVEVYQAFGFNQEGQAIQSNRRAVSFEGPVHLPGPQPDLR